MGPLARGSAAHGARRRAAMSLGSERVAHQDRGMALHEPWSGTHPATWPSTASAPGSGRRRCGVACARSRFGRSALAAVPAGRPAHRLDRPCGRASARRSGPEPRSRRGRDQHPAGRIRARVGARSHSGGGREGPVASRRGLRCGDAADAEEGRRARVALSEPELRRARMTPVMAVGLPLTLVIAARAPIDAMEPKQPLRLPRD
jgi:hypothetical protein